MYLTTAAAPAVLLIGLWGAVFAYGGEGVAGAGRLLLLAGGLALGLLWLSAQLRRSLDPPAPGLGVWKCRRCGTPARSGDTTCAVCGGTRFGRPPAPSGPG